MTSKKLSVRIDAIEAETKPNSNNVYRYGRKASVFISNQFKKARLGAGEKINLWLFKTFSKLSKKWFTHLFLSIVLLIYTIGGAVVFLTIEGQNEKSVVRKKIHVEMRELLLNLKRKSVDFPIRTSQEEWNGEATRMVREFESMIRDLYDRHPLVVSNAGGGVWNIWNSVVYCATLYTTIGYGHLYPTTFTGRVLTIAYSLIGIPLFLIVLTDFGKLFTRAIKFIWSFVRRLYYTGSCRKARKTTQVQEILKGAQIIYEVATLRRPSVFAESDENPTTEERRVTEEECPVTEEELRVTEEQSPTATDLQTPTISAYEIDDEFNLPISLALVILVIYILCGALIYMLGEDWDFFSSFYFVFISMSTIGFGDYVPQRPICMIVSIIYLCFGLAFMTMCFNVVQDKMGETFTHASTKIGATIGLQSDDDTPGTQDTVSLSPVVFSIEEEDASDNIKSGESNKKGNKESKADDNLIEDKFEKSETSDNDYMEIDSDHTKSMKK